MIRLLGEIEQILTEGDLDIQRNREQLKSVRRGEWSLDQVQTYFEEKEKSLEQVYIDSNLPYGPDEKALRNLYGDLSAVAVRDTSVADVLRDFQAVLDKHGG